MSNNNNIIINKTRLSSDASGSTSSFSSSSSSLLFSLSLSLSLSRTGGRRVVEADGRRLEHGWLAGVACDFDAVLALLLDHLGQLAQEHARLCRPRKHKGKSNHDENDSTVGPEPEQTEIAQEGVSGDALVEQAVFEGNVCVIQGEYFEQHLSFFFSSTNKRKENKKKKKKKRRRTK